MRTSIRQIISDYKKYQNQEVKISGWIRNNRAQKEFGFINLNDGTTFEVLQIVYEEQFLESFKEISKFQVGSSIYIRGIFEVTDEENSKWEIKAKEIVLIGDAENFPIQPKRHTKEFLREVAHLRMRTNLFNAIFRVRSLAAFSIHKFFQERNFIYVHTPIITAGDAEGAGQMFQVTTLNLENLPKTSEKNIDYKKDFFGKKTNLTVSGQLEAEAFAQAFRDVYTFGPTFRAENSNTMRHASEFWMIEPEIAFADLEDDMRLAEDMIKYIILDIMQNAKSEMQFFENFVQKGLLERLNNVLAHEFKKITHHEAITILKAASQKFENEPNYGEDLATEHEKYLTEVHFKAPVFITNWPKEIKAFYMRLNDDGKTVAAMDLLVPGSGELIGGSQREERLDLLEKRMAEMHVDKEELQWYLDLRRFGGCKHAGFGLGFERLIMYLTGVENIRDVIPFFRTPNNCDF